MTRFFLLCLFLLSSLALARDPWASQTGLTRTQLDTRLAAFAGLAVVPEQITGYEDNGELRYTALWAPRADSIPRQVLIGLTAEDFSSKHTDLRVNGWRLHHLNGYHFGSTDYYNAIYRRIYGPSQTLRLGENINEHNASHAELTAAGNYLENLTVFRSAGTAVRYAAFWNQAPLLAPQTEVSYSLTPAGFDTELASRTLTNWRVHSICGHQSPATLPGTPATRHTVIWRRPALTTGGRILPAIDKANYAAAHANHIGIGWRPAHLQAWKEGSNVKFNALWIPNGGLDSQWINRLDTLVNNARAANNIPALSLAISRGGRLVFNRAYGLADTDTGEWAGADHRFRFASVAKAITGAAVVHALENQTTRTLSSPLFGSATLFGTTIFGTTYGTPPYSENERAMTIRHLLHHTSGWAGEGRLWWDTHTAFGSDPNQVIDWHLDNVDVIHRPGDVGRYSNFGYTVAARVVERLSGKTYENYVLDHLFTPSGVTGFYRPRIGGRTKAEKQFMEVSYYPHTTGDDGPYIIDHRRMDGSTGWVGRPSDLLLLGRRVDGDPTHADILSADSITALHTRSEPQPNSFSGYNPATYGLGWYTDDYTSPTRWGHNGSMNGTRAEFHVGVNNGTSLAWAANTQGEISFGALQTILNDITAANAWPDIDLFGSWHPAYNAWVEEHFTVIERTQPGLGPSSGTPTPIPTATASPTPPNSTTT